MAYHYGSAARLSNDPTSGVKVQLGRPQWTHSRATILGPLLFIILQIFINTSYSQSPFSFLPLSE